mgnify:CR=1 FL=1
MLILNDVFGGVFYAREIVGGNTTKAHCTSPALDDATESPQKHSLNPQDSSQQASSGVDEVEGHEFEKVLHLETDEARFRV